MVGERIERGMDNLVRRDTRGAEEEQESSHTRVLAVAKTRTPQVVSGKVKEVAILARRINEQDDVIFALRARRIKLEIQVPSQGSLWNLKQR